MSSESGKFSFRQECEVSMWLLADGLVPISDEVCAFLGNGPSFFWLGKSKPMLGGNCLCKSVARSTE